MWDGKVMFVVIVAVIASAVVGRMIAATYRRRVLLLMSTPAHTIAPLSAGLRPLRDARPASREQNCAARRRTALLIVAISLAIGLTQAWWELEFVYNETAYGPIKLALWGLMRSWIVVPALGLLWRWGWGRVALGSLAYVAVALLLILLRSDGQQSPLGLVWFVLFATLPTLIVFGLAASGPARATGPYLLPLFILLGGASIIGTDLLDAMINRGVATPIIMQWVGILGAVPVMGFFALAPWVLLAWPAWRVARAIARGYERHLFSEPLYLMGSLWLVALLLDALAASHSVGAKSLLVILCWLWLPLGAALGRRWLAPPPEPPNLLVLRVFRRDAEVQALFDSVIRRWRSSGTVSLIAGTDLALQTLDPDELFAFLNGRLEERFIRSPDDLARQLAAIDNHPDPDGRFRVTDFYCLDTTWKLALDALVVRADVVLMDLRGLAASNLGCLHELAVLARAAHLLRVVLLFDAATERPAAQAAIGNADPRFAWFDATRLDRASAEAVAGMLLDAG